MTSHVNTIIIEPIPERYSSATYQRIWRKSYNGEPQINLCKKCEHPLMDASTDRPKLLSKIGGYRHRHRYYHLEKCKTCSMICGENLYFD